MENDIIFNEILTDLNLGLFTAQPQRVYGGYMHKMYRLETTIGKYAVKLLNPLIMKRQDVFRNFQRAERLEKILEEKNIPIVPALEINGRKMQYIQNQYYYIFPWIDGKTLNWTEIKNEHCKAAGEALAKIHKTEIINKPFVRAELCIDWDFYVTLANRNGSEIADDLRNYRKILYSSQNEVNLSLKNIPTVTCICHGDMDSKNVLWVDDNPFIIDLECLDYGNSYCDMFQLALSWSGIVLCSIDYELLKAFLISYRQVYGNTQVHWDILYGSGFIVWLEWLEYNIKRALGIECADEEDRQMGINEAQNTINRIVYYHSVKEKLLQNLAEMK